MKGDAERIYRRAHEVSPSPKMTNMKEEDKLIGRFGRETGFKAPDGYFDDFCVKIAQDLPEYPRKPEVRKLTRWERVRPYVYLAAMFCGIWCMMKVFHDISSRAAGAQDAVPESVVLAMSHPETADYLIEIEDEDYDVGIEEEVSASYESIDDFESDFGYTLKPEYDNIEIRG